MGGGDLNMKKHFHPLTMENLEKVWKAEEQHKEEMKRIEERKKEIEEERSKQFLLDQATSSGVMKKRDERLEWMYTANRANNEEFLLGKEITNEYIENTANLEKQKKIEDKTRIFGFRGQKSAVIDLERKIKEDPLFLIKKRELAATKDLINNSVRIQQIVKSSERRTGETVRRGKNVEMTPNITPLNKRTSNWDTPMRSARSNISSTSRDKFKTPRNSNYKHERDQDFSRRSDRRNYYDREKTKRKETSKISEEEKNEKLKRMMSNAEWRESTRKENVQKMKEEEEIEKKLEEKLNKLKNSKLSTPLLQKEVIKNAKMGNYSSKRYVK